MLVYSRYILLAILVFGLSIMGANAAKLPTSPTPSTSLSQSISSRFFLGGGFDVGSGFFGDFNSRSYAELGINLKAGIGNFIELKYSTIGLLASLNLGIDTDAIHPYSSPYYSLKAGVNFDLTQAFRLGSYFKLGYIIGAGIYARQNITERCNSGDYLEGGLCVSKETDTCQSTIVACPAVYVEHFPRSSIKDKSWSLPLDTRVGVIGFFGENQSLSILWQHYFSSGYILTNDYMNASYTYYFGKRSFGF
ncbi:hypothetical protein [Helicobacter sp. 11S02629-2]|uniref:hypothetical protein n=1 Tax=Helicobacter sp. 11S02629-2 TaxID=1476195 RepID=UPI000BA60D4F|nr:hypothetical protein [Helicobacter sp. 11S02629-2]PAF42897.1 hypothetical protein BKH40_07480 [Helicobacter sp. 11S02629-2]